MRVWLLNQGLIVLELLLIQALEILDMPPLYDSLDIGNVQRIKAFAEMGHQRRIERRSIRKQAQGFEAITQ